MVYLYDVIVIYFYTTIQENKVREKRIAIESVPFVNIITVGEPHEFMIFSFSCLIGEFFSPCNLTSDIRASDSL